MSTTPRERPGAGDRFFANLAYLVPGYQGYKTRASRQEEDARLRHRVLDHLGELSSILRSRRERLKELSLDSAAGVMAEHEAQVESLSFAVRYAPYGFLGFFDAETVEEDVLERLLEHDLLLFQDLDEALEFARGTPFPPSSRSGFDRFFAALGQLVERIGRRLVSRDKLLGNC